MMPEKFQSLAENAGSKLAEQLGALREKAEHFIAEELQTMKDRGDAFDLSPDEIAMLKAYRGFVARRKPGDVFSWRPSFLDEPGIIFPPAVPVLIRDPREVSVD